MIQTFKKNFDKLIGEDIYKANLSHKTQLMAANPPYERFK